MKKLCYWVLGKAHAFLWDWSLLLNLFVRWTSRLQQRVAVAREKARPDLPTKEMAAMGWNQFPHGACWQTGSTARTIPGANGRSWREVSERPEHRRKPTQEDDIHQPTPAGFSAGETARKFSAGRRLHVHNGRICGIGYTCPAHSEGNGSFV